MKKRVKGKRSHRKQEKGFRRFKRSDIFHGVLLVAFLFLALGCGKGTPSSSSPERTKSPSVERKTPQAVKLAEKKEMEKKEEGVEFTYSPGSKPDPFKPFIQLTSIKESRNFPLTPLQKYEISQLKLVAIISTPGGKVALVEDSAGKGYFLKRGTGIGKNDGKVTKILNDKVIVEETYQDIFGRSKTNEISLFLHRFEEGGES